MFDIVDAAGRADARSCQPRKETVAEAVEGGLRVGAVGRRASAEGQVRPSWAGGEAVVAAVAAQIAIEAVVAASPDDSLKSLINMRRSWRRGRLDVVVMLDDVSMV